MAQFLQNVRALQTEHHIPMRMDLSNSDLLVYYKSFINNIDSVEGSRILQQVINDLKTKNEIF